MEKARAKKKQAGSNTLQKEIERLKNERHQTADRMAACMRLTAIGQMTAGVAHELNNPLSVILGFAQSLTQQYESPEALHTSLKTVEREALRCKRLVQDLLSFARLQRPGKVMEDVIQVLEGALSLVETQARIQHVDVVRNFEQNLPMIYLDRHRIQQMIINLCTNSIDAMPNGGQFSIVVALASGSKESRHVQIKVRDTGTGIPREIRHRIFEPFFTTKELGKGTGLGLSLVRDVVLDHAAHLEIESEPNRGTICSILLPVTTRVGSPVLKA